LAVAVVANAEARKVGRLQAMPWSGVTLTPDRVAKIDINGNRLSDWVELKKGGATDGPACASLDMAFDCYDMADTASADPVAGDLCGLGGPGYRWFFGPDYNIATQWNDMSGVVGPDALSRAVQGVYFFGDGSDLDPGTPELEQNFAALIFTSEDWASDGCTEPAEVYDGIVAQFDGIPADPGGYYVVDVDVCDDPSLFWTKPTDGAGAYLLLWATYDQADPDTLFFTSTDVMQWGTCDAGGTPCTGGTYMRVGTQDFVGYIDDLTVPLDPVEPDGCPFNVNMPDGIFGDDDLSEDPIGIECECVDLAAGLCPDPLGMMFALLSGEGGVACVGDIDGDGMTCQSDLGILLAAYGTCLGDADYVPAADLDPTPPLSDPDCGGDTGIGQGDLGVLLADYTCGTPAGECP
jgi:hypothetical protein